MGAIAPSKMPSGVRKARRDDTDFTQYAEGGSVGLYANINAKRKRIAAGSHDLAHLSACFTTLSNTVTTFGCSHTAFSHFVTSCNFTGKF